MKKFLILFLVTVLLAFSGCHNTEKITDESILESVSETVTVITPSLKASPTPEASKAPESGTAEETAPKEEFPESNYSFDPYDIIKNMSDEELVGQLFLARAPELHFAPEKAAEYHLGGYILFSNHTQYESPETLKTHIDNIQKNAEIPLLIAVDEEGGSVTRISRYSRYRSANFPSMRNLFSEGGKELIIETEKEKCVLLKNLGFNVNLAPVCDITTNKNAFMYYRSLGQDAETTGEVISGIVSLYKKENFGAVLKHFPGYGNNTDTHLGVAEDDRSLNELILSDLIPFMRAMKNGADAVMVSHTFVNSLDETLPASLSPKVISFLRQEMNFEGVIITDDLAMEAVTDLYGAEESAVLAIEAGADLLCSTEFEIQYEAILNALKEGRIKRENLEKSAARVLIWKHKLGLIN
ncbi:MAG: beta-hexosaminidase [Ruminococcaceae bacterium]|nr:beta-hexosaminidase [Oscillospiraceae bacterium]